VDWFRVVQDRDHWRVLVDTAMYCTFWFHNIMEISWVAEQLLASQELLSSIQLVCQRTIKLI
jgi:hypothetical protein